MSRFVLALAIALVGIVAAAPADAQEIRSDDVRSVEVSYQVGPYDPARQDWGIIAVVLRGDLDPDESVTVELWDGDRRLWAGTGAVSPFETRLAVDSFVAIGDLVEVGVWQPVAMVEDIVVLSPEPFEPSNPSQGSPLEVEAPAKVGDVTVAPRDAEVLSHAAGGGSGQLAVAMVLVVIVLVVLFRTPLPSATSQRWTK
jgi:hypothetical protein